MDKLINWCTQNGNQQIDEDWVNILRKKIKPPDEVQSAAGCSLSSMTLQDLLDASLNKEYSLLCTNCGSNSTVLINPLDKSLNSTLAMAKKLGADLSTDSKLVWNSAYETPPRLNPELCKPESNSSISNLSISKENKTVNCDDISRISPISSKMGDKLKSHSKKRPLDNSTIAEQSPPKRKMVTSNLNEEMANSCDKMQDSLSPKLKSKRKFPLRNKVLVRSLFQSSSRSGSEFDIETNSRCKTYNSSIEDGSKLASNQSGDGLPPCDDLSQSSRVKEISTPRIKSIFSTSTPVVPSSSRHCRCDSSLGSSPTLSKASETGEYIKTLDMKRDPNYSQSSNFITKDCNVIRRTKSKVLRRQSSLMCSPLMDKKLLHASKDKSKDHKLDDENDCRADSSNRSMDKKLKDSECMLNEESNNFNALDILCSPVKASSKMQTISSYESKGTIKSSFVEDISEKIVSPSLKRVPTTSIDCHLSKTKSNLPNVSLGNSSGASIKNTSVSSILDNDSHCTAKTSRVSKLSASGRKKLNNLLSKSNERVMSYPEVDEEVLQEKEGLSFKRILNVNEKGLSGFTERDVTLVVKKKTANVEEHNHVTEEQRTEPLDNDDASKRNDENLSELENNPIRNTSIKENKTANIDSFEDYDDCNPDFENYLLDLEKQNSVLLETTNNETTMHDREEQLGKSCKRKYPDNDNELKSTKISKLDNSDTIGMNARENEHRCDASEKSKMIVGCKENIPTLNKKGANLNVIPNSSDSKSCSVIDLGSTVLPKGNSSSSNNSYGGFSTAAGKSINISKSSLLQAKRVWEECSGSEISNVSSKTCPSASEVAEEYSKKTIVSCQTLKTSEAANIGFSTAGGKALIIKPSSLQRARNMWSECSGESSTAEQPVRKDGVLDDGELNASLKNRATSACENNAQPDDIDSSKLCDKVGKNLVGFSSASGKSLNFSQSSLIKAKNLLNDCDEILDKCSSKKDATTKRLEGFTTASVRSFQLDVKDVAKNEKSSNNDIKISTNGDQGLDLFNQLEMTIKKSKGKTKGFSLASGSAFQVSDAAMKKAQSMWSSILSNDSDILSEKTDLECNLKESGPKLGVTPALETNVSTSSVSFKKPIISAPSKKKGFIKHQIDTSGISGNSSGLPEPSTFISKVSKRFYPSSSYVVMEEPPSSVPIATNASEMRDKLTDAERNLIDEQFDSIAEEFLLDDEFYFEQVDNSNQSINTKSDIALKCKSSNAEDEAKEMHLNVASQLNGDDSENLQQAQGDGTDSVSSRPKVSSSSADDSCGDKLLCDAVQDEVMSDAVQDEVMSDAVQDEVMSDAVQDEVMSDAVQGEVMSDAVQGEVMSDAVQGEVTSADGIERENKTPTKCSNGEQTSPIIAKSRLTKNKIHLLKRNYPLPSPLFKLPGVKKLPDRPFRVPGRNPPASSVSDN